MLRQRAEQLAAADKLRGGAPARAARARARSARCARGARRGPLSAAAREVPRVARAARRRARARSEAAGRLGRPRAGPLPPRRDRRRERRARPRRAREPERRAHAALPRPRALAAGQAARGGARVRSRERARPRATGVAGLYAGRSWASAQDREKARAALERARAPIPIRSGDAPRRSELEVLDAPYRRHVWAKLRAGVEHDSNVTLQNDDSAVQPVPAVAVPGAATADEHEDTRAVFEAEGGLEFLRDEDQAAGGAVGYNGNAHDNVHELDLQYPWLDVLVRPPPRRGHLAAAPAVRRLCVARDRSVRGPRRRHGFDLARVHRSRRRPAVLARELQRFPVPDPSPTR